MKKDNAKYKLPTKWIWTTIGEVGVVTNGGTPSTQNPEYWGDEIDWITPADLSNYNKKYISKGARSLTQAGLDNSSARLLPKGSVLFSSRAPIGYVAIARNNLATNQGFKNLICTRSLCSDYVYYYFKTIKPLAEKKASGTTFLELSANKFNQLPFPLPPLNEQYRIVAKIEELFSELDHSVFNLKKAKQELKVYRQVLLRNAFEGKLTNEWREAHKDQLEPASLLLERIKEKTGTKQKFPKRSLSNIKMSPLPDKWCWCLLSNLGELDRGKSKHRPRNDPVLFGGKYPFIQTGDVRNSKGLIKEYTQTYNEVGLAQSKLWPINTLCITIAANIAETALLGIEACFPDSIVGFIADKQITIINYVHYFMKTIQNKLETIAPATAQKNINLNILKDVMVPLPPIEEQRKIVEEIERCFSIADEMNKTINQSLQQANSLRQSILKKAFEGSLVQQDSNDEDAIKLLHKIRDEKENYLIEKRKFQEKKPIRRLSMKSNRTIIEILEEIDCPIEAKDLWLESKHKDDIEAYYAELKKIEKNINVSFQGKKSFIGLKNENR